MKRVALLNSPWIRARKDRLEEGNVHLRMGIATMAALLRQKGGKVTIVDSHGIKSILDHLADFQPDVVGIPAYSFEVGDAARTAEIIRTRFPHVMTVVGGPHASALPKETLEEFPAFHVAAFGEGEETLLEIAEGKPLPGIRGVAYREDGTIRMTGPRPLVENLDSMPFPAWDMYDLEHYRTWGKGAGEWFGLRRRARDLYLPIESVRGCPYDCIFCFRVTGRRLRQKSAERVVEEMEEGMRRYGATRYHFIDGTFGIDKTHAHLVCDLILGKGLNRKVTWEVSSRVDTVDRALLKHMREAGCDMIGFGIESGDEELLRKVGKKTSLEQIWNAAIWCREIGLEAGTTFIMGHPYETEETLRSTIRLARRLPVATTNFAIMVPFPGTRVREMAEKREGGLRLLPSDWVYYGKQIGRALELDAIPRRKLLRYQTRAYLTFYLSPSRFRYILRHLTPDRILGCLSRLAGL